MEGNKREGDSKLQSNSIYRYDVHKRAFDIYLGGIVNTFVAITLEGGVHNTEKS